MQNVSFFSYLLTLNQSSVKEKRAISLIFQILYSSAFGVVLAIVNNFNMIIFLLGFMAFFAAIPQLWARSVKPNLTSLVPLSQKRKTIYSVLSIPAMFVVSVIVCGAIIFSIWLLSGLAAAGIAGNVNMVLSVLGIYFDGIGNIFADGYAALFLISVLVYIFGSGIIYSFTDNKKYRNITAIALFVVALTGAETLLQVAFSYGGQTETHVAGFAGMFINCLPLPWLAVTLCLIISVCVLSFGLYLVIQKNKAKNY